VSKLFTFWLSVAIATLLGVGLAFVPLLAVHGVESALVLGLVLPPFVAATAASYAERNWGARGLDLMLRAIGAGLLIWAIPVVLLALSSLRVRQCAPGEGLAFMVLGPGVGCILAACVGVWVAGIVSRPRLSPWLAAAIPVAAAFLGLWTFYATPTVYVFGAFAGYFPGAIYDDLVRIPDRYLTYRAAMLIAALALALLFDALWEPTEGRLIPKRRGRARVGTIVVAAAALGIVGASYWHGDHLGHWVTDATLIERLGKTERGEHCLIHMPRETLPEDAERLLRDCDFHVARTRALAGLSSTEPVTVYVFRDQNEKKNLIGIGRTLIAKPWRREIYLQRAGWPHPVMGHEIVHAVLEEAGRGPFAISGHFAGLVPNPGIVEGAATALAWDVRDDLDPDQWSKIMLDRQELPAASQLLSVRFTSLPARRAYMAAGSLIRFLIGTRGMESFLETYRSGKVEQIQELERDWHEHLNGVEVTTHESGVAEVALAQPSIFTAVCPHELAKLRTDLFGDLAARDDGRTIETCRAILDIDANEAQARASLVGALARNGSDAAARKELASLRAAMNAPKPIVATALEQYADARWTLGHLDEAGTLYDELLAIPRTDAPTRQSEVKKIGLGATPEERELIYEMLLGRSSSPVVVHLAHMLSSLREDGLGPYLEARQLMGQHRFKRALPLLEEAEQRGLPTDRLERELNRLIGITLFALGRHEESAVAWKTGASNSRAAAAESERWLERIEYAETKGVSPALPGPSSAPRAAP
jgi:tetratricopeptide (TPR) repeat protein